MPGTLKNDGTPAGWSGAGGSGRLGDGLVPSLVTRSLRVLLAAQSRHELGRALVAGARLHGARTLDNGPHLIRDNRLVKQRLAVALVVGHDAREQIAQHAAY